MSSANQQTTYLKVLSGRLPKRHLTPIQKDVILLQRLAEYRCTNTRVTGPPASGGCWKSLSAQVAAAETQPLPAVPTQQLWAVLAVRTGCAADILNPEATL